MCEGGGADLDDNSAFAGFHGIFPFTLLLLLKFSIAGGEPAHTAVLSLALFFPFIGELIDLIGEFGKLLVCHALA